MDSNTATNHIVSPKESMLDFDDTPEKANARAQYSHDVRKRITLDPSVTNFTSRGSVSITWTHDNGETWQELEIPLKSLGADRIQKILSEHRVDDSYVPRIKDEEAGNYILDENTPEYNQYLSDVLEAAIDVQYDKLLHAFDGNLMSRDGRELVWSCDNPELNDHERARDALDALCIPHAKLSEITARIDTLSIKTARDKAEDFAGKLMRPSESQENSTSDGTSRSRRRGQRGSTR